jgi:Mg2+ and Co2+ transporter CorA
MKAEKHGNRALHVLLLATTLGLSILAVSNLMSILLSAALGQVSLMNEMLAVGYLLTAVGTIFVLARAIYKVDKKAGRIRNKVGWFE